MPRSGFGAAVTWMPAAWRRSMTPFQLEESAKAPWTSTTVSGAWSLVAWDMRAPLLGGVDLDDGVGERLGGFLGKVVADAALDGPMRIGAGKLAGIGAGVRMRGAVGVAFEGDGGHADHRPVGELLLQLLVVGLAVGQAEPPAVVVDQARAGVGVVERLGGA